MGPSPVILEARQHTVAVILLVQVVLYSPVAVILLVQVKL
jgi:hypothetical protein